MTTLTIVDSGVIYRNPDPGHRHVSALFPNPLELPDGQLLCAYNHGSALYAADLAFFLARSTDGGVSWRSHDLICDRSRDNRPYSYHDPFLSRMRDGTLLIGAFRADRSDPEQPMFNEQTGGLRTVETILLRSADDGRTWSSPEVVELPEGIVATPAAAVLELYDGRWFWPFDQWNGYDDQGPYQPRTLGFFSKDQGRTWGEMIAYADGAATGKGFWHGKPIVLADGHLQTIYWAADMRTGANLTNHLCIGDPAGQPWSEPEPVNLPGQTSALVDMGGSCRCIVYTWREAARPGIMAVLSEDGGRIWDLRNQIRLWDASGRDRLGVVALDAYPRSHDTIAFGAPAALRLSNGDVYAAWWCMEAAIVHARWARLRVVSQ
jgi:sialidase-1